jgi:hypothetical protein
MKSLRYRLARLWRTFVHALCFRSVRLPFATREDGK